MSWLDPQQGTLKAEIAFSGIGIHTGQESKLRLRPAPVGRGRVFVTSDGVEVPANIEHVIGCDRSTILGKDEARISTPEHLLSALAGAGIDNVEIEICGHEVPILDGSAKPFWEAITTVGRQSQDAPARVFVPDQAFAVGSLDGPQVLVFPDCQPRYEYLLHYPHPMLGTQQVSFTRDSDYGQEIAPARTFALWEEVQPLLERGMALGGRLDNALVVYQDRFSSELRLEKEPVAHKCLDLIGDFALLDARLQARVLAVRAGHRWHVEAARKVWEEWTVR